MASSERIREMLEVAELPPDVAAGLAEISDTTDGLIEQIFTALDIDQNGTPALTRPQN
eukprot:SAG31_NODE_175_length_21352_cov_3.981508_9_plen_58_part_00